MIELFNMIEIKQLRTGDLIVSTALKENQSYILQLTLGSLYQSSSGHPAHLTSTDTCSPMLISTHSYVTYT